MVIHDFAKVGYRDIFDIAAELAHHLLLQVLERGIPRGGIGVYGTLAKNS